MFHIIEMSTTMDADDVTDNFLHFAGSYLPQYDSGSMTSVDATYDLGDSTTSWKTLYCNYLTCTSMKTNNVSIETIISDVTLSTTSSRIEITGLNGDAYTDVILYLYQAHNMYNIYLYPNGDSSASFHCTQYIDALTSPDDAWNLVRSSRNTDRMTIVDFGNTTTNTTTAMRFGKSSLKLKTGKYRSALNSYFETFPESAGHESFRLHISSAVYKNSTNTITTLVLIPETVDFYQDTRFILTGIRGT